MTHFRRSIEGSLHALSICVFSTVIGCGPSGPIESQVDGTFKVDGKPVLNGVVVFEMNGETSKTLQVKDGKFSGKAWVGSNRVQFASFEPLKNQKDDGYRGDYDDPRLTSSMRNVLPEKYGHLSDVMKEIKAEKNNFDFDLATK
jgi:hypothetical protein